MFAIIKYRINASLTKQSPSAIGRKTELCFSAVDFHPFRDLYSVFFPPPKFRPEVLGHLIEDIRRNHVSAWLIGDTLLPIPSRRLTLSSLSFNISPLLFLSVCDMIRIRGGLPVPSPFLLFELRLVRLWLFESDLNSDFVNSIEFSATSARPCKVFSALVPS